MTGNAKIWIVGAGLMGHGIAQVFAVAGHAVAVYDPVAAALASLHARIGKNLADLGQDPRAVDRVRAAASLADAVADADVVIEAALEELPLKHQILGELD